MLPPARGPARRGPCPRAGSRTRRNENRRCRARKRSTERDAPSATAPKARAKILPASLEATALAAAPAPSPRARRVGARYRAHPEHIALALCEGRRSAPEACGVPPAAHARPGNERPGDGNRPLPASERANAGCARVTGRGTWGPARRARCRAPGTNAPHAGARRARGRMVRRVRREESRSAAPESRAGSAARRLRESATTEHVYSRAQVVAREPQQAA